MRRVLGRSRHTGRMISMLSTRRVLAPLAVVVPGLVLLSCGSDGGSSAALKSDERSAEDVVDEEPTDSADSTDYCEQAQELADADADVAADPAAGLERIESLQSVAPDELDADFDVIADVVEQLSALDEDDPESFEQIMTIAFDPEVMAASDAIATYTQDECGIDLEGSDDSTDSTDTTDTFGDGSDEFEDGSDPTELHIEDVDVIKESSGGTWAAKLSGTAISMGVNVQVSAMDEELLTADEALAACQALMTGLGAKNPEVTVDVYSGETLIVAAPAGGTCAQV